MKWNYRCPNCNTWGNVDWEKRNNLFNCHNCKKSHYPPTPSQQQDAYVDTRYWPEEIKDTVINFKGNKCTVPRCTKNYQTLDQRIAFANSGRTSVDNLYPMCNDHNQSEGDKDYQLWLAGY